MKNIITLFSLLLITCFATAAFAGESKIKAELRSLEGQLERNELHVAYEISPKSWQAIQKAGIRPELNVFEATKHGQALLYSVALNRRVADIGFGKGVKIRKNAQLLISIEGRSRHARIDRTSFETDCAKMIPLDLERRGRGDKHDRDDRPRKQHDNFAASIIRACGEAMDHNPSECIKLAGNLEPAFAATTITACGNETDWDTEVQQCLRSAAAYQKNNPAPVIAACGDATNWSSELVSCITTASTHTWPTEAVQACDAHTEWNSDLKQCLSVSASLGRKAPAIINACGDTTHWASELTSCIRSAGPLKRRG